jgi:hypothetical protein
MEARNEHVNFRGGELMDRLRGGPLSVGATAKRDLIRYYQLIEGSFDGWYNGHSLDDEAWDAICEFVATREWVLPFAPYYFRDQARQFLASPMGQRHKRVRDAVLAALGDVRYPELVGIIDAAEREVKYQTQPDQPDAATGGAT